MTVNKLEPKGQEGTFCCDEKLETGLLGKVWHPASPAEARLGLAKGDESYYANGRCWQAIPAELHWVAPTSMV